jgi:hypothetical protein
MTNFCVLKSFTHIIKACAKTNLIFFVQELSYPREVIADFKAEKINMILNACAYYMGAQVVQGCAHALDPQ